MTIHADKGVLLGDAISAVTASAISASGTVTAFKINAGDDRRGLSFTGNVTASTNISAGGNISASGNLFASTSNAAGQPYLTVLVDTGSGQFYYTGSYGGGGGGGGTSANNKTITLTAGDGLKTGGSFTTNQSANSTITFNIEPADFAGTGLADVGDDLVINVESDKGNAQHFVAFLDGETGAQQLKTSPNFTYNPATDIMKVGQSVYIHGSGSVTASKNIWVSNSINNAHPLSGNYISASNIIASHHITASGNISSSGTIIAKQITVVGGTEGVTFKPAVTISNAAGQSPIAMNRPPSAKASSEVLFWEKGAGSEGDNNDVEGRVVQGTIRQVINVENNTYTIMIDDLPVTDGGGKKRGAVELNKATFVGSPGIMISSGSISFYTSSVTASVGSFNTASATVRMFNLKGDDGTSFVMSGSKGASIYFSGSTSGKVGIGTTDPQAQFEVAADEHIFRRRENLIGLKINSEGNVESFNKDSAFSATGSEVILSYTAGGKSTVTAAAIRAVFGDGAIAADANQAARDDFFDNLRIEAKAELLHFLEKTGEFGVGAGQIGDIVGSVRWLISSGSAAGSSDDALDRRRSGELAAIRTQITDADDTGAIGQLQIRTSTGKSTGAVTRIELKPNGQMIHSGSINTYRNNTLFIGETAEDGYDRPISFRHSTAPFIMGIDDSQDRFCINSAASFGTTSDIEIDASGNVAFANGNITVAGNITANGNIIGDDATDITNIESIFCDNIVHDGDTDTKIAFGTDTITLSAGGADLITLTEAATNTIALGATISTHVTASGNISSSALIQGQSIRANDLTAGRVAFAGTAGLLVDDADLTFAGATLTATNIAAFNLTGKLTAGNGVEIEGNAFDINGGTIDGVTSVVIAEEGTIDARAGALATSAAQNLAIVQGAGANVDIGTFSLTANTLVSDVATGTAPLTVTSTTAVANLQASTVATIAGLAPNTATTQATQAAITTAANLTTVGALNAGSITSGFTSIDVGSGAISSTTFVGTKHILYNSAFYVNDNPFIQNSLYFGGNLGHQQSNWNDPQAIGGDPMTVSTFNIGDDDQNWGHILPFDVSKIEILCGLRPGGTHTDQFSLVLYTAPRTQSATQITLTRVAEIGANFLSGGKYRNNDLTYTADVDAGVMIYVGVGTNTSSPTAKNARGYMSITVTQR